MSKFKFGTTRIASAFYAEYTGKLVVKIHSTFGLEKKRKCSLDENGVKFYGEKDMNSLVGVFPTYGALFENFGKAADENKYTVCGGGTYIMMRISATKPDGTPYELEFALFRKQ